MEECLEISNGNHSTSSSKKDWSCPQCTLVNPKKAKVCEACGFRQEKHKKEKKKEKKEKKKKKLHKGEDDDDAVGETSRAVEEEDNMDDEDTQLNVKEKLALQLFDDFVDTEKMKGKFFCLICHEKAHTTKNLMKHHLVRVSRILMQSA